ncbi:MAG: hypothetical protein AB7J40_02210 [Candidatus Altimarinota bacterium]
MEKDLRQMDAEPVERADTPAPKTFMEWLTPAYRQTEKSKAWYAVMGLVVLLFVFYDLMTGGWIVSVTFLLLSGVYYLNEAKPAPTLQVAVSDYGIRFGAQYFSYDQIKSFWILNDPEIRTLYLKTYKGVDRQITIMIPEDVNIAKLREYLQLQITEEQGKKESFSDQLIRNLGL